MKRILLLLLATSSSLSLMGMDCFGRTYHRHIDNHVDNNDHQMENKIIVLPKQNRGDIQLYELLEMDERETFTHTPFHELIKNEHDLGHSYLMARVETYDTKNQKQYVHYYDANTLNDWLGGYGRPEFKPSREYKNPVNTLPILSIDYFMLNKAFKDAFTHNGSYHDFSMLPDPNKQWKEIFYENRIKQEYQRARQLRKLNPEKAYECYAQLAQQPIDRTVAVTAKQIMAMMCRTGERGEWNIRDAIEYYKQIMDEAGPGSPLSSQMAHIILGIYRHQNVPIDSAQLQVLTEFYLHRAASDYSHIINNPEARPADVCRANLQLGCLYYNLVEPSTRACELAQQYLNAAADQEDDLEVATTARLNLQKMNKWYNKILYKLETINYLTS